MGKQRLLFVLFFVKATICRETWNIFKNRLRVQILGTFDVARLKTHCHGADWINMTIKKKRIRQGSVISLYSEIHEDDNDLIPFILKTKCDPRA